MFEVGFSEIVVIFALALVVLGPERLPRLASSIGRWVGRARAMARQFRDQLEMEAETLKSTADTFRNEVESLKSDVEALKPELDPDKQSAAPSSSDALSALTEESMKENERGTGKPG